MERNPNLTEREQREMAELEQLLSAAPRADARDGGSGSGSRPGPEQRPSVRPN